MVDKQFFNRELCRLMKENNINGATLARRMKISPSSIYRVKNSSIDLTDQAFLRILREGFWYSKKEVRRIFLDGMCRKYLSGDTKNK